MAADGFERVESAYRARCGAVEELKGVAKRLRRLPVIQPEIPTVRHRVLKICDRCTKEAEAEGWHVCKAAAHTVCEVPQDALVLAAHHASCEAVIDMKHLAIRPWHFPLHPTSNSHGQPESLGSEAVSAVLSAAVASRSGAGMESYLSLKLAVVPPTCRSCAQGCIADILMTQMHNHRLQVELLGSAISAPANRPHRGLQALILLMVVQAAARRSGPEACKSGYCP